MAAMASVVDWNTKCGNHDHTACDLVAEDCKGAYAVPGNHVPISNSSLPVLPRLRQMNGRKGHKLSSQRPALAQRTGSYDTRTSGRRSFSLRPMTTFSRIQLLSNRSPKAHARRKVWRAVFCLLTLPGPRCLLRWRFFATRPERRRTRSVREKGEGMDGGCTLVAQNPPRPAPTSQPITTEATVTC